MDLATSMKKNLNKTIFKTLFKKEFFNILNSKSFWISFILFYLILSFSFVGIPVWFDIGLSTFSYFFSIFPVAYTIVIPMLTVEIWTDEYKKQTVRLLFLFPISESKIVVAKFFAISFCFLLMTITTILIPLSITSLSFLYLPSFLFSYITVFCFGLVCLSISLGLSSIFSESAMAFSFSFLTIAFFSLIHFIPQFFNLPYFMQNIIRTISFNTYFQNAKLGIFSLKDYIFYIALIFLGLSFNVFILKLKRSRK